MTTTTDAPLYDVPDFDGQGDYMADELLAKLDDVLARFPTAGFDVPNVQGYANKATATFDFGGGGPVANADRVYAIAELSTWSRPLLANLRAARELLAAIRDTDPVPGRSAEIEDDVRERFDDHWRRIVMPDGEWDHVQVMRELHDYWGLLDQVPIVYCEVSGNRISKPNTLASAVIGVHDELFIRRDDIEWTEIEEKLADELTGTLGDAHKAAGAAHEAVRVMRESLA